MAHQGGALIDQLLDGQRVLNKGKTAVVFGQGIGDGGQLSLAGPGAAGLWKDSSWRDLPLSEQNADQAVAAIVDDPFQGDLKPAAGLLRHVQQFGLNPLVDQLVEAFCRKMFVFHSLPGSLSKSCKNALDQLLPLLLTAHAGGDFRVDGGPHDMQRRRTGGQPDAVLAPLPDNFGSSRVSSSMSGMTMP